MESGQSLTPLSYKDVIKYFIDFNVLHLILEDILLS